MLHSPSPALRILVTNTAIFILGDTAVVLCVPEGEGGVATQAGELLVCASVPAHVVVLLVILPLLHPGHLAEGDQLEEEEQ